MEIATAVVELLDKYIATRPDADVAGYKDELYSIDVVIDAYEKGTQEGHKNGKEAAKLELQAARREEFYNKFKLVAKGLQECLSNINSEGVKPCKMFLKHTMSESKVLITIAEDSYNDEKFISNIYGLISKIELSLFAEGVNLDISFISDMSSLNVGCIRQDGYGFAFDFTTNTPI